MLKPASNIQNKFENTDMKSCHAAQSQDRPDRAPLLALRVSSLRRSRRNSCHLRALIVSLASDVRPIPPVRPLSSPGRLRPPRRHRAVREWPPPTPARSLALRAWCLHHNVPVPWCSHALTRSPRPRPLACPPRLFTEAQSSQYPPGALFFSF